MTNLALTRRQLARIAFAGAAGTWLAPLASAQNTETTPMPVTSAAPDEGPFLAEAVPLSVGYALTETQTKEVSGALKDYPGPFGKVRTYPIPDDVPPAWTSALPPTVSGKGRGK